MPEEVGEPGINAYVDPALDGGSVGKFRFQTLKFTAQAGSLYSMLVPSTMVDVMPPFKALGGFLSHLVASRAKASFAFFMFSWACS